LKALRTIHSHNVTHYDLKCDNILISFADEENSKTSIDTDRDGNLEQRDLRNMTEDDFEITIGDFGECKIFSNERDEFCVRNRGTDAIKSPEVLYLAINTRKDHDKYDRRKKVGTNRLSDIWSIGCVFFELLTGDFLMYHPDWAYFFVRVIKHSEELVPQDKLDMIDNN
jgi:serine/threonine protein kinase